MEQIIEVLTTWWPAVIAIFYIADKIVKATPTEKDDFVVDILFQALKKIVGKK